VDDLSELYSTSRIVICPLLSGSGTKIKLQEAMTYAIPIVTTRTGASGLSLKDGINAFITDEPDLYAQRILNLLKEPKLAQKVSEEVAMTFENEYSIQLSIQNLMQCWEFEVLMILFNFLYRFSKHLIMD
jgi:glycosyltransferase involved in cell wall biosynthesis